MSSSHSNRTNYSLIFEQILKGIVPKASSVDDEGRVKENIYNAFLHLLKTLTFT
ncbi:MAG: hypothetical protein ACKOX6_07650 [Bdellovibrio sp.]